MTQQPDITPAQLLRLIASNAKAIEANSAAISELRQSIAETREVISEGFNAAARDIQQLAEYIHEGFRLQGQTNHNLLDRVDALEQSDRESST